MPFRTASDGLAIVTALPWTRISPLSAWSAPKMRPGHLGPPGPHQPGKAEDLAAAKLEADVADHPAAVEAADLEHDLVVALLADLGRRLEDRRGRPSSR